MATDNHLARGPGSRPPTRGFPLHPGALLRPLLLGTVVFALAVLTGALLSGAAPAIPAGPPGAGPARTAQLGPLPERVFARSLVYTGSAGLAVSVAGLVMVGRRRRLW